MEYGEQTLKEYLQNNKGISLIQKLKYCQQMCESIQFIHKNGYTHGDVRSENFVMIEQKQNQYFIKLKDFGIMSDEPIEEQQQPQIAELVNQFDKAPVIIKQEKYDKKSDIWSLGCVFCEILARRQLFNFNANDSNLNVQQDIIPAIQNIMIP